MADPRRSDEHTELPDSPRVAEEVADATGDERTEEEPESGPLRGADTLAERIAEPSVSDREPGGTHHS